MIGTPTEDIVMKIKGYNIAKSCYLVGAKYDI
jgi:hypothetical protein